MREGLSGKTVVVTRAQGQAEELINRLTQAGAHVIHFPTIRFAEPNSWRGCDHAIETLSTYEWLIFTSCNGVQRFLERLRDNGNIHALSTLQIAVVGERTEAELRSAGIFVNLVPTNYSAEGLLQAFQQLDLKGKNVLIAQAQQGRKTLLEGLKSLGANVDVVAVYKTEPVEPEYFQGALNGERIDLLTFTSPSTFRNFVSLVGGEKIREWRGTGCAIAAIGEVTAAAIAEQNFAVDIVPSKSTAVEMVEAISEFYS